MRPATTIAGVTLKAQIAMRCFDDTLDEAEMEIDNDIEESAERLALSIVKDLARMAPGSAMGGLDA